MKIGLGSCFLKGRSGGLTNLTQRDFQGRGALRNRYPPSPPDPDPDPDIILFPRALIPCTSRSLADTSTEEGTDLQDAFV